jgi:hypothetical protein
MRDLLCICRPTPKNEAQSALWKRVLNGELETPYTWESELSSKGNNAATWEALIDSGKVGYMALLRNLRNILNAKPTNVDKVLRQIQNPEAVRRSRQLPFRYLSAYKEVGTIGGTRVLDALENAVDAAVENIPKIPGTTVVAVDTSGSMSAEISGKSSVRCYEIAMMLGLIANRICENAYFYTFDTTIRKGNHSSRAGILSTACGYGYGGGTNMYLVFNEMMDKGIDADRVIILSDNECNTGGGWYNHRPVQVLADVYRKATGKDIWVHAVDLLGYGTQQFHGSKTNVIAGWSEKVFDFILLAERGIGSLEEAIEDYAY